MDVQNATVVASSERVRLTASVDRGVLRIDDPLDRFPALENVRVVIELVNGSTLSSEALDWQLARSERVNDAHGHAERVTLTSSDGDGVRLLIELSLYDECELVLTRVGVENCGQLAQRVRSIALCYQGPVSGAALRPPASRWRWYRHGWQSWTPSLSLGAGQRDIEARVPVNAPAPLGQRRGELSSEEVALLLDTEAERSLVVGFVSARRQWTQVQVETSKRLLRAIAFTDDVPLSAGETLWSERLLIEFADEPEPALRRYADTMAREMSARVPELSPAGWCSWYYYFTTVSEADVLRNLRFLEQHRREVPVQLVQIDDGYQADIGDWTTTNDKFPRGMAPLARDITDAGFVPGIWLAPLLAGERSALYTQNPSWVIQGDGEPALAMHNWSQRNFGLDCSNPAVENWLRDLFREVSEGWGYEYVKVDFLYGAAIAGRRHDERSTRIDSYRRGLAAIREGVGPRRFILGCGALMGASVGIVDAQRIGPDVAPWWRYRPRGLPVSRGRLRIGGEPATDNAIRNILTRSWMHGRLWANDPDCVIARRTRTKLSLAEVQTLATAIAMSGGAVLLSDDMEQLSDERLNIVSSILPPLQDEVSVHDLMRETTPPTMAIQIARPFESWLLVAHFNWDGRRRSLYLKLPPGHWHAFEFWERRYLGAHSGELTLRDVPAHGARIVSLRPVLDRPQVVGTDVHFSMGGHELTDVSWDDGSNTLQAHLRPAAKRGSTVYVHVPKAYHLEKAVWRDDAVKAKAADEVLAVTLTVDEPSDLTLKFKRV